MKVDEARNSDLIVTTSTATINGATLAVSGMLGSDSTYTILIAASGEIGTFNSLTNQADRHSVRD
ncbi:hypothetical protein SAMN05444141_104393 [Pseudovibrio denitrificans]|uniref:Uncharacterized protein n=1 Tax=Pseudovibrio denitrificans TaxID=258256 RepID=A0A1I7BVM1_9HYPH|nr:hypothetical protein [Pseudovibrio denitrificans]SFT91234.1 hypothetical protein SAMN05444141_104393 [Pseudovibrio denitrificans]